MCYLLCLMLSMLMLVKLIYVSLKYNVHLNFKICFYKHLEVPINKTF